MLIMVAATVPYVEEMMYPSSSDGFQIEFHGARRQVKLRVGAMLRSFGHHSFNVVLLPASTLALSVKTTVLFTPTFR
jgi:hypothetical protein